MNDNAAIWCFREISFSAIERDKSPYPGTTEVGPFEEIEPAVVDRHLLCLNRLVNTADFHVDSSGLVVFLGAKTSKGLQSLVMATFLEEPPRGAGAPSDLKKDQNISTQGTRRKEQRFSHTPERMKTTGISCIPHTMSQPTSVV